ncbi:MAG: GTPase Era [Proteobacteria bacterium]|nr:GTPase Era [Pseudomonadota bacterium]
MSGEPEHRCGVVALLGRPNAGKSSLLNALLGQKISIATARAQTTRGNLLGVLTRPGAQLLFHDTPGWHPSQRRFNLALSERALRAAEDADVRLLLFEAGADWDEPERRLAELAPPVLVVRTKCDRNVSTAVPGPERFAGVLETSALEGQGIEALVGALLPHLPAGPALYPEDFLTDAPMRFLAAERIREVAFEQLREEVPYALAVEVTEWKESDAELRIRARLLVERDSQMGIVVGQGGQRLGRLGREARRRLAELVGKTVHLNLRVKTDRGWTRRPRRVRQLGYL